MLRLKGIIYLALSSLLIWHEFGTPKSGNEWIPQIEKWASTNSTLDFFVTILLLVCGIVVLLYFFKGFKNRSNFAKAKKKETINWRV